MQRERTSILPAVLFSALVHVVLLYLAWQHWPKANEGGGTFGITPVTLVAQGPVGNTTAPVPETPEDFATPDPVPEEDPAVVTPPTPAPVPTPAPTRSQTKPAPPATSGVGNRAPADDSFLTNLAESLRGGGGARQSGGAQGPARAKTGTPVAATGGCLSANNPCPWKEGLGEKIERYWNPNCAVEGGASVRLVAKVTFNADGLLIGEPEISDARSGRVFQVKNTSESGASVSAAAAIRAYSAIRRILPYTGVPKELVGRRITMNLNADKACQ
jgi:outer membrane biosynthesis protein TonB